MIEYDPRSWPNVLLRLRGTVIAGLLPRVLLCAGIGLVALLLKARFNLHLPGNAHGLVGVAMGLLLVFRTNASYDRFWEGRRLFGAMVNRSRDLVRQGCTLISGDTDEARRLRARVQRLVVMYFCLQRQLLRKERELGDLGLELEPEEHQQLEGLVVRPILAIQWLSATLAQAMNQGYLTPSAHQLLDANITQLVDAAGGTERIMRTPIPFAYAHHIKAFLLLFCTTVPFTLVEPLGKSTPLASAIIAFGLFGIEEIGVEIEDPFGTDPNDLPLDTIGKNIERDTLALLRARDPV